MCPKVWFVWPIFFINLHVVIIDYIEYEKTVNLLITYRKYCSRRQELVILNYHLLWSTFVGNARLLEICNISLSCTDVMFLIKVRHDP